MQNALYTGNPVASYLSQKSAIDAAIAKVLTSSSYVLGPHVAAFEGAFAAWTGASDGVSVGTGTDAVEIALASLGVGPGDEVITVGHTAIATVAAIKRTGAEPVLVDVEPHYHTLDPARLADAMGRRVKAVLPVHLYGQPAAMDAILSIARDGGAAVVEDCAQAHGATYRDHPLGSLGDAGAFSFYPTKNLGAAGDGGAIVTSRPALAERARLLRQYGWVKAQYSEVFGWVSRLDELQAAILLVKLAELDEKIERRRAIAQAYTEAFADLPIETPKVRDRCRHAFHLYVIETDRRDEMREALARASVFAGIHYPYCAHQQPGWREIVVRGGLAVSERLVTRILSLPLYPEMADDDIGRVIDAVRKFHKAP